MLLTAGGQLEHNASATHDSLPDGRTSGALSIQGHELVFVHEQGETRMPIPGLSIQRGGANNKLFFFAHTTAPGWSVFTRDAGIVKQLQSVDTGEMRGALAELRKGDQKRQKEVVLVIAAIIFFFVGLWLIKNPVISVLADFVPRSWEEKAGDVIFTSVSTDVKMLNDEALTKELETLVAPLVDVAKQTGYTFKFHLARGEDLNAFALPGGHIVVYSAVILKADKAEEVLGVLAHEIAHVTERHTVKQIFSVLGVYFVFDVFLGNFMGTFAALTQAAPYLLQQGFSRGHEREADEKGFNFLLEANINPEGMVSFFKRIKQEQDESALSTVEKHLNFLSTHPGTEERISTLEAKVRDYSSREYRKIGADFEQFKQRLRAKVDD